ncbi:MAG: hypothetical protein EA398_06090 [Deltaproteobacteria bacterium]|nr:MAG: hypothetical protein EA398_06090 [Deltaproteobacteria bacterium]
MRISIASILITALALPVATACGSRQAGQGEIERPEVFRDFFTEDHLLMRRYDTDFDGIPDVFKYYAVLDDDGQRIEDLSGMRLFEVRQTRLVRAEYDLNHDGRVDLVRFYGPDQELRREEADSRRVGSRSVVSYFENNRVVRREIDHNGNGIVDETRFYAGDELSRIEFADLGDGRVNRWHFFNDGQLVRIGYDRTGDGVIDEREILQIVGREQSGP